jgi:hypothetical protein
MHTRQVNIRLPDEVADTFEAVAFLEGTTVGEHLRTLLVGVATDLANDGQVQGALRLRAERSALREGKLAMLRDGSPKSA